MTTPTARTLMMLRDEGWLCQTVERWQASFTERKIVAAAKSFAKGKNSDVIAAVREASRFGPGRRIDLFGFIDIIAVKDHILGIQCTTSDNVQSRVLKIKTECCDAARSWLNAGGTIEAWGWRKHKQAVERKFWRPRIIPIQAADLAIPSKPF